MTVGQYGPEVILNGNVGSPSVSASLNITVKNPDNSAAALFTDTTGATSLGTNVVSTDVFGNLTFFAAAGPYKIVYTDVSGSRTLTVIVYEDVADIGVPTVTAPVAPAFGRQWNSLAATDVVAPDSAYARNVALTPTATWEGPSVAEPSVYHNGTVWCMVYTGSFSTRGLGFATCPTASDPTVAANWTKVYTAAPFLGIGNGGEVNQISNSSVYIEGSTVYLLYTDQTTGAVKMCSWPLSSVTPGASKTNLGAVLSISGTFTAFWNTSLIKVGSTYRLMVEASSSASPIQFQIGQWTATAVTGPYTLSHFPITQLSISGNTASGVSGGPSLHYENGIYTLIYHATPGQTGDPKDASNLPTHIYRATTVDIADVTKWQVEPDPFIVRAGVNEVDQVADPTMSVGPDGTRLAFWAGMDNRASPTGRVMACILSPVSRKFLGGSWTSTAARPTSLPRPTWLTKHLPQTTDYTMGTGNAIFLQILSYTPKRSEMVTIDAKAFCWSSVLSNLSLCLTVDPVPVGGQPSAYDIGSQQPAAESRTFKISHRAVLQAGVTYNINLSLNNSAGSGFVSFSKQNTSLDMVAMPL